VNHAPPAAQDERRAHPGCCPPGARHDEGSPATARPGWLSIPAAREHRHFPPRRASGADRLAGLTTSRTGGPGRSTAINHPAGDPRRFGVMRWMSDCALARSSLSVTAAVRASGLPPRVVSRGMFTRLPPRHVVTTRPWAFPRSPGPATPAKGACPCNQPATTRATATDEGPVIASILIAVAFAVPCCSGPRGPHPRPPRGYAGHHARAGPRGRSGNCPWGTGDRRGR
jgi:hypothetical protein